MNTWIFALSLITTPAIAAQVNDIKVLEVKHHPESLELKLGTKHNGKSTHFTVDIPKTDPENFEKMSAVIQKLSQGDAYTLNLDIPSFSAFPSGSYYKSPGIKFLGSDGKPALKQKTAPKK
ncbi:hypothetical protein ACLVWU_09255 [Bdellovibrio sp. HCB290]|uniref:hypothetical protein n=1 Tax=Bdellovibrio sp. HCB290 TaxID=3394356 RepID=UPI0039B42B67